MSSFIEDLPSAEAMQLDNQPSWRQKDSRAMGRPSSARTLESGT